MARLARQEAAAAVAAAVAAAAAAECKGELKVRASGSRCRVTMPVRQAVLGALDPVTNGAAAWRGWRRAGEVPRHALRPPIPATTDTALSLTGRAPGLRARAVMARGRVPSGPDSQAQRQQQPECELQAARLPERGDQAPGRWRPA